MYPLSGKEYKLEPERPITIIIWPWKACLRVHMESLFMQKLKLEIILEQINLAINRKEALLPRFRPGGMVL